MTDAPQNGSQPSQPTDTLAPNLVPPGAAMLPPGVSPEQMQRFAQMSIRYNSNDNERKFNQERTVTSWQHCRPNSIYVAAIGHHWKKRSWARVMDMVHYANQQGFHTALDEIQDRCYNPYDALGTMRNEAIFRARQGWEFLCYIDNDVLPEADTLVRLVSRGYSIIAPFVEEPGTGKILHGPERKRYSGVQPVRWSVLSMLIFRTSVFNATGPHFWADPMGADEGFHFQKLYDVGHVPFIDTETILPVASAPTYPLTTLRITKEDHDAFWQKRKDWLLQVPDREPIIPGDTRVQNSVYLPFLRPVCRNDQTHGPMEENKQQDGVEYICRKCEAIVKGGGQIPEQRTVTVDQNVPTIPVR